MDTQITVKQSTLRSRGFRIVKLGGPITQLSHDRAFTVNGKPARFVNGWQYRFNVRGWYDNAIPRDIQVIKE